MKKRLRTLRITLSAALGIDNEAGQVSSSAQSVCSSALQKRSMRGAAGGAAVSALGAALGKISGTELLMA